MQKNAEQSWGRFYNFRIAGQKTEKLRSDPEGPLSWYDGSDSPTTLRCSRPLRTHGGNGRSMTWEDVLRCVDRFDSRSLSLGIPTRRGKEPPATAHLLPIQHRTSPVLRWEAFPVPARRLNRWSQSNIRLLCALDDEWTVAKRAYRTVSRRGGALFRRPITDEWRS
jgi:hypothetical protein